MRPRQLVGRGVKAASAGYEGLSAATISCYEEQCPDYRSTEG